VAGDYQFTTDPFEVQKAIMDVLAETARRTNC
jgi:hypothetical protein